MDAARRELCPVSRPTYYTHKHRDLDLLVHEIALHTRETEDDAAGSGLAGLPNKLLVGTGTGGAGEESLSVGAWSEGVAWPQRLSPSLQLAVLLTSSALRLRRYRHWHC